MNKRIPKILFHVSICFLSWLIFLKPMIHYMEGFGPLGKAISEISLTDVYFSKFVDQAPSNDIYIVDIGELPTKQARKYLSSFLKEINLEHQPRVIGLDIFFSSIFSDPVHDSILQIQISKQNVVRACKLLELEQIEYVSTSDLDLKYDFNNIDGYTNSLGDPTVHPCVRSYLPQKLIKEQRYYDFSVLVSKKADSEIYSQYISDINPLSKKSINYNVSFKKNIIDIRDTSRYSELKDKIVLIGICTYDSKGIPKYTDDTWFTPLNDLYIGRSQKDMYGVEIKATIISNIINGDYLNYSHKLSKLINLVLSLIIYFILLILYAKLHESFVFVKVFSQTFGVLSLAMFNIIVMSFTSLYLDLTASIVVLFLGPYIVEFIESISIKYKWYENANKFISYIYSTMLSINNK